MTEYFTSCALGQETIVRAALENDQHAIVETVTSDIVSQTYANNIFTFTCGIPGTNQNIIIHSRK
jgi:hypothetical protein